MKINDFRARSVFVAALVGTACPVLAQTPDAADGNVVTRDIEEILVTARKREETALEAPVILQAYSGAELERRGIVNLDGIARATPLLIIGEYAGGTQGGTISMRGIAGPDGNAFGDQAVSFNLDGVQVARATVRRLSTMDFAAVEVLKGPQALFFGKNSPGGVVSIRTADPTPDFAMKASLGYEFEAHELSADGFVSGPVTDSLGLRIAAYATTMRGWIRNNAQPNDGVLPSFKYAPGLDEVAGRVTLRFEPNDRFDARLKLNYNYAEDAGHTSTAQLVYCGRDVPGAATPAMDCKADNNTAILPAGTAYAAMFPGFKDGRLFSERKQFLPSLELNYKISDDLTLTSLTSLYRYKAKSLGNFAYTDIARRVIMSGERLRLRDLTQELRLLSSFDSPVNFLVGGFVQDSSAVYIKRSYRDAVAPVRNPGGAPDAVQDGTSYSLLGQVIVNPVEQVEMSAGARWSREKKNLHVTVDGAPVIPLRPKRTFSDFSPEITVAWRPNSDLNVFASFKEGFLSGGFNAASSNFNATENSYDQQTLRGFEAGVKARMFDGAVRANFATYYYKAKGLQVSASVPTSPFTNALITTNAGRAYTTGAEFDANWVTPVEGLNLYGAVAYNKTRYTEFPSTCWRGQTPALGCNLAPTGAGVFTLQSLDGFPIVRSPKWGAAGGANYEMRIGGGLKLGLSADANHSGSYYTNVPSAATMKQDSYWLLDGSIRFGTDDDRWQLALMGLNLTDEHYLARTTEVAGTGSAPGSTGTALADQVSAPSRGREIMLRLTVQF